jgi:hypothetical protein
VLLGIIGVGGFGALRAFNHYKAEIDSLVIRRIELDSAISVRIATFEASIAGIRTKIEEIARHSSHESAAEWKECRTLIGNLGQTIVVLNSTIQIQIADLTRQVIKLEKHVY